MKFGPYTSDEMKRLQALLLDADVEHDVSMDSQELEEKLAHWRTELPTNILYRTSPLETSCLYVEIDATALPRLGDRLTQFGIDSSVLAQPQLPAFDEVGAARSGSSAAIKHGWVILMMLYGFPLAVILVLLVLRYLA